MIKPKIQKNDKTKNPKKMIKPKIQKQQKIKNPKIMSRVKSTPLTSPHETDNK